MLTRLRIKNFKTLDDVDIPLASSVVFVGPNNSGKTSALQALSLWQSGVREWNTRRSDASVAKTRTGVTINRLDLTHTPISDTRSLWRDLRVNKNGETIFIKIRVDGDTLGQSWSCGFDFYHANRESLYCRLLTVDDHAGEPVRLAEEAAAASLALLPPMSGLASEEAELQPGRIAVLLGEGQTAQVLRNLCLHVYQQDKAAWKGICDEIKRCFGIELDIPQRDLARGTVSLTYKQGRIELDLPSAGRGMQQVLLLLSHLHANKGSALLLDEPDAHLEILRQRQVYSMLSDEARKTGSQIIVATHSEVVLNEAADKDLVVAFVGKPHRIDDRGSQVLKSLREIGFDQYYQAEIKGFVLYLEGSTDLEILKGFARILHHRSYSILDNIFVHYVGNQPKAAEHHFFGLREAKPDLLGFAVFDRLDRELPFSFSLPNHQWKRREIENYVCTPAILHRYAAADLDSDDLVGRAEKEARLEAMSAAIKEVENAIRVLGRDPWSADSKVSDDLLPAVFKNYFAALESDNKFMKSSYYMLTYYLLPEEVDSDILDCLDKIAEIAVEAKPAASA